jgi:hypothetical protein
MYVCIYVCMYVCRHVSKNRESSHDHYDVCMYVRTYVCMCFHVLGSNNVQNLHGHRMYIICPHMHMSKYIHAVCTNVYA